MKKYKALIVLSGGQDSVTCLGLAIKLYGAENVAAIGFNYGQQHAVEINCATLICNRLDVPYKVIDISFFGKLVTSSLTGEGSVSDSHPANDDLPASFVPNRNALFLTIAHAYAQEIGATYVYTGVCETDYSGYPDCRSLFIGHMETALNVGYEVNIQFVTPLMHLTKAETFQLAEDSHCLQMVLKDSHTCYEGDHTTENIWGFGCGVCPSCLLRKQGFNEFITAKGIRNV